MVQSALAANRAVAILDWIVSHPGESFTLSELSRALSINIPSAMSVLQSLTDGAYLSRHPTRKTYEAGPALLAVGLVSSMRHRSLEILGPELTSLAEAVGSECHAVVVVGSQTIVVAEAGRPNRHSLPVRIGFRWPLIAPVGHLFMAWADPAEIEAWIQRGDTPWRTLDRERLHAELATVRRLGYSAHRFGNHGYQPSIELDHLAASPKDLKRQEKVGDAIARFSEHWELIEPEPGQVYDVSNVSAPLFDGQGRVLASIIINGFGRIEGRELAAHIDRLLQTARLLTKHGNGRAPD